MDLRYGKIDENVLKRSVEDVILHEKQRFSAGVSSRGKTDERKGKESGLIRAEIPGVKQEFCVRPAVPAVSVAGSRESAELAGELAVVRSANNLAAAGIRAEIFSPVILLPPGTQEETLRAMLSRICSTSFSVKIDVSDVYAEVTDAVRHPVVSGSMSGTAFNKAAGSADLEGSVDLAGMDIIQAGFAGLEGSAILTRECRDELGIHFPLSFLLRTEIPAREMCVMQAAETAAGTGARVMVNLSCGGFFAGMWELSKRIGCGFTADLKCVPLLQETIEITNHMGINPYTMRSEGGLLIAVPDGKKTVQELMNAGIFATRIGALISGKDKIIRNGEDIRFLDRPGTDSLDMFFHERAKS